MVATLTRIFGLEHFTLAEDVVQATLARALWFDALFSHSKGRVSWPYPSKAIKDAPVYTFREEPDT